MCAVVLAVVVELMRARKCIDVFFFFQAEDGIRDPDRDWSSDVCSSDLPDFILVDARRIPHCTSPQRGIIKGDTLSASIAAASIIAKTTRDTLMAEFDSVHPGYN